MDISKHKKSAIKESGIDDFKKQHNFVISHLEEFILEMMVKGNKVYRIISYNDLDTDTYTASSPSYIYVNSMDIRNITLNHVTKDNDGKLVNDELYSTTLTIQTTKEDIIPINGLYNISMYNNYDIISNTSQYVKTDYVTTCKDSID
jgi:hypothetical protein